MRKITLTLLGLIAVATTASAQEVKFGPKAGVNFTQINGKIIDEGDSFEFDKGLTGFHIGAFAEIKFNEKFAIQPELLYSTQGGRYEESESGSEIIMGIPVNYNYNAEAKWNLHYINVPIMAKYYVIPSIAIEAGPYVGFNMSSKAEYELEGSISAAGITEYESDKGSEDMKKGTNSIDFGLGVGASFNLDNGFFASVRYNLGLTKIAKEYTEIDEDGFEYKSDAYDIKNGVFQVSVGFKF